jgi:hypothetical protein
MNVAARAFLLPPPLRERVEEGGSRGHCALWLTPLPALLRSADLPLKGGGDTYCEDKGLRR